MGGVRRWIGQFRERQGPGPSYHGRRLRAANAFTAMLVGRPAAALELTEQPVRVGTEFGQRQFVQMARAARGRALVVLGDHSPSSCEPPPD